MSTAIFPRGVKRRGAMLNGLKARQRRRGRNSQKRKRPRLPLKRRIISSFSKIILKSTPSDWRRCRGPAREPEDHTSEFRSQIRIPYAFFCLKKKHKKERKKHL